jgi:hypothetical protein
MTDEGGTLPVSHHEGLAEGWEPDLPSDDSLLLAAVRNHAAHAGALAEAMGWRRPAGPGIDGGASGLPHPFANLVVLTAPVTTAVGRAGLDSAADLARDAGAPLLLFSAWPTDDLRSRGFTPVGHPPLMFRPAGNEPPPPPPGLVVEPVADAAQLAEFERTVIEGYPVPELADVPTGALFGPALLATGWRFFVGRVDGRPVAASAGYVSDGIQVVEMVSTPVAQRGRGYGAAVTWAATTVDPALPAMLIASDLGQPVYRRMGYLTLSRFTLWVVPPG